ncbi:MAG TPA: hypothetical protein VG965_02485 [Patescibacteria group bacterium]|nr:hypothetical protein [Patescibacteria group bacterium]
MKILRLTRHKVTEAQINELHRIYGDIEIIQISENVPTAARIQELIAEHSADVLEAVLPLTLIADYFKPGGITVPLIRAVMDRHVATGEDRTTFTFSHYERILKVEVHTERL